MRQPETAASKLIDRANLLLRENDRNLFTLTSIKKDAQSLLKADAFSAYLVLGIAASLERNIEAARDYHAKAIKLCDNYISNFNFGASLDNLGEASEALVYYEKAVRLQPENLGALDKLVNSAMSACRFRYALSLIDTWDKLNPEHPHQARSFAERIISILESRRVSDEESARMRMIATTCMLEKEKPSSFEASHIRILEDESAEWIDYFIEVNKNVTEVTDMNCNFAEAVAEDIESKVLNSIVVRFLPATN